MFRYHTSSKGQAILASEATLINGLGHYASEPNTSLAIINVQQSVRYRFRLVAISCDPNFVFSIDNHNMVSSRRRFQFVFIPRALIHTVQTIIEADGGLTQPLVVDSIQIYAGQRYSFILTADQPVANYWIRANPNNGNTGFTDGINSAVLRYIGASVDTDPTTTQTTSNPLLEQDLHPFNTSDVVPGSPNLGEADVSINLDIGFNATSFLFTVNNATFTPPTAPVLLQILSGARTAQELLPSGDVYVLPSNKVIEVTIPGGNGLGPPVSPSSGVGVIYR